MAENYKEEILQLGKSVDQVQKQLLAFQSGFLPVQLHGPCTPRRGIVVLSPSDKEHLKDLFNTEFSEYTTVKFVPASGAASRMFKHLFESNGERPSELVLKLIDNIDQLPFIEELQKYFSTKNQSLLELVQNKNYTAISRAITLGLDYAQKPKGQVPFHKYPDEVRNAFEEHLHEAQDLFASENLHIHFTVAEEFLNEIKEDLQRYIEDKMVNARFHLSFSVQNPQTDTIAVTSNNIPAKDKEGKLIFRPGGHGSLIYNLNDLDADMIFIKNIDNVVPDSKRADTILYKKLLAGLGMQVKKQINLMIRSLRDGSFEKNKESLQSMNLLGLSEGLSQEELLSALDRPLRICGMVLNEGEPGGGPFWVSDTNGGVSKQIVEKAQINLDDPNQKSILESSTHFNPVDLICFTKNAEGNPYNLIDFVDSGTGFITEKSVSGRTIKALEHPGLWNGAMAGWNTIFVEVPLTTFNPVKTVNDLLRPMHTP